MTTTIPAGWKLVPASLYDLIRTGDMESLLWQLRGVHEAEEVRMALYNARKAILDAEEYEDYTPSAAPGVSTVEEQPAAWMEPGIDVPVTNEYRNKTPLRQAKYCVPLYKHAPVHASAAGDALVLEFVREVAQQKPEKPDHWSSCGQCQSNSRRAEELLDDLAAQRKGDA